MHQKFICIGRLTRDPETRNLPDGATSVVSFGVAVNEQWRDKNNDKQERVEFFNAQAWNKLGTEIVAKYLRKGSLVYLEGKFRSNKWTDKEGVERVGMTINVDTVKMLGDKKSEHGERSREGRKEEQPELSTYSGGGSDDIPF